MLVGYFGRDVTRSPRDNAARSIRLIEPTHDAWDVAYFPIEGPEDIDAIRKAYAHGEQHEGPAVVLIGAPTS
jgi:hypothetical protein